MKKNLYFGAQIVISLIAVAGIAVLVCGQTPALAYHPAKAAAISLYYFFEYTGEWFDFKILVLSAVTVWGAAKWSAKGKDCFQSVPAGCLIFAGAVVLCFFIVVEKTGNVGNFPPAENVLAGISLLWWETSLIGIICWQRNRADEKGKQENENFSWALWVILAVLILSCLPIVLAGKYVFPQGDDFEYGAYCHQAWINNIGVAGVLKGAGKTVGEAFFDWQGTFSSIFFMALQPGVWGTKYYHLVPFLLLSLLISAVLFFFYVLFQKVCGASAKEGVFVGCLVALTAVQLAVSKPSAFFWYNGAIHYLGAFSFLLFFLSFLLLDIVSEKRKYGYEILAALMAVLVGGGNLVTALIGNVISVYLFLILLYLKKKKACGRIALPCCFLFIAFLVNTLAPGNFVREAKSGDTGNYGVVTSILKSFQICLENAFGEWTDWFWLLLLLMAAPVLWKIVKKAAFHFPLPGVVLIGSYCLLSAMYTPQLFALGQWRTGRIQNITYFMFLILCVLNELYFMGWARRRFDLKDNMFTGKGYAVVVVPVCISLFGLTAVAAPDELTTPAVIEAVRSGEAQKYAEAIEENIALLESDGDEIVWIKEPPRKPEVFVDDEIEAWRLGAAAYYGKKAVRYEGESLGIVNED